MFNRPVTFALLVVSLGVIGCGSGSKDVTVTGADGSQVSVSGRDGNQKVTTKGLNGETLTVDTKNGQSTVSGTDKDGGAISASMGGGTTITEAELGIPFYPGSIEKPTEQMKVETEKEKDYMSSRTTTDDPVKVGDFYKEKVKGSTLSNINSTMVICAGNLESGAKFSMTAERKSGSNVTEIKIGIGIKK